MENVVGGRIVHDGNKMWITRGQWPYRLASNGTMKMTSDLNQASSFTLVSTCIFPLRAISVAFEAMVTSKWPWRSFMMSNLNSVDTITYAAMLFWPLCCCIWQILPGEEAKYHLTRSALRRSLVKIGWNESNLEIGYFSTFDKCDIAHPEPGPGQCGLEL